MGNKLYEENSISAIASAIRNKLGTDAQYRVGDMSAAIASIPTGVTPTGTLKIATNGTYDVTNYASAEVATPVPSGNINITANAVSKIVDVTNYVNAYVYNPLLEVMDASIIVVETDTDTLTFSYDTTKEVKSVIAVPFYYPSDAEEGKRINFAYLAEQKINDLETPYLKALSYNTDTPNHTMITGSYVPDPVFDSVNGTVTIAGRNSSYKWKAGTGMLLMIVYNFNLEQNQNG